MDIPHFPKIFWNESCGFGKVCSCTTLCGKTMLEFGTMGGPSYNFILQMKRSLKIRQCTFYIKFVPDIYTPRVFFDDVLTRGKRYTLFTNKPQNVHGMHEKIYTSFYKGRWLSWHEANNFCSSLKRQLLVINSFAEFVMIRRDFNHVTQFANEDAGQFHLGIARLGQLYFASLTFLGITWNLVSNFNIHV